MRQSDIDLSEPGFSTTAGSNRLKTITLEYEIEPKPRNGGAANRHLHSVLANGTGRYLDHLRYLTGIREEFYDLPRAADPSNSSLPHWDNGFLPGLDIVSLHGYLRRGNPKRYFEIGSGNSTKIVRRAIDMHRLRTAITSVDPHPRAEIDKICDRVVRTGIEHMDLTEVASLEAGDVLFLDGSHHAYMNSDVTVFFLEILPILDPGVLIQVHDICLPYDYPSDWWHRCYSEQYLLGCALLYGADHFRIEFPSMFVSRDPALSPALAGFWDDPFLRDVPHKHGASFWFRIADQPLSTT